MTYEEFLEKKKFVDVPTGIPKDYDYEINSILFDFQKDIVKWSLSRGRSCIWAQCGLGKTFMQLEWARVVCQFTGKPVLILAPLAVSEQTANEEAPKLGIRVQICSTRTDVVDGINITNYEKMDKFDFSVFSGIVADESSIIKHQSGKIRNALIEACQTIPFRLACTATPAPNDFMELGNHAEFVGAMTYHEMLSMFFVHDGGDTAKWRLKGHAKKDFFKWIASWAVMIRKPSDLGYNDDKFILPELKIHEVVVNTNACGDNLFPMVAETLQERQSARRCTIKERTEKTNDIINEKAPESQWCVWTNLNAEADLMCSIRKDKGMINIQGSDTNDFKTKSLVGFAHGKIKEIVSKPKIAGLGMNMQKINHCVFLGLSDSFEQYYQAVRRFWRFGQKNTVHVYIVTADTEGSVVENIKRKEHDSDILYEEMVSYMRDVNISEVRQITKTGTDYRPDVCMLMPSFI